jgi:hypothetical protein
VNIGNHGYAHGASMRILAHRKIRTRSRRIYSAVAESYRLQVRLPTGANPRSDLTLELSSTLQKRMPTTAVAASRKQRRSGRHCRPAGHKADAGREEEQTHRALTNRISHSGWIPRLVNAGLFWIPCRQQTKLNLACLTGCLESLGLSRINLKTVSKNLM